VHVIEGDVIGPRIMGKAVGIHPATGLIALVAGTELFGIWAPCSRRRSPGCSRQS
jgi:predicted PurR-regulated permease PerM